LQKDKMSFCNSKNVKMNTKLTPIQLDILDALNVHGAVIKKWRGTYLIWSKKMKKDIKEHFFNYLLYHNYIKETATAWKITDIGKEKFNSEIERLEQLRLSKIFNTKKYGKTKNVA